MYGVVAEDTADDCIVGRVAEVDASMDIRNLGVLYVGAASEFDYDRCVPSVEFTAIQFKNSVGTHSNRVVEVREANRVKFKCVS